MKYFFGLRPGKQASEAFALTRRATYTPVAHAETTVNLDALVNSQYLVDQLLEGQADRARAVDLSSEQRAQFSAIDNASVRACTRINQATQVVFGLGIVAMIPLEFLRLNQITYSFNAYDSADDDKKMAILVSCAKESCSKHRSDRLETFHSQGPAEAPDRSNITHHIVNNEQVCLELWNRSQPHPWAGLETQERWSTFRDLPLDFGNANASNPARFTYPLDPDGSCITNHPASGYTGLNYPSFPVLLGVQAGLLAAAIFVAAGLTAYKNRLARQASLAGLGNELELANRDLEANRTTVPTTFSSSSNDPELWAPELQRLLLRAAMHGDEKMLRELCKVGVDLNGIDQEMGSALETAIRYEQLDFIKTLLSRNVVVTQDCLDLAAQMANLPLLNTLLERALEPAFDQEPTIALDKLSPALMFSLSGIESLHLSDLQHLFDLLGAQASTRLLDCVDDLGRSPAFYAQLRGNRNVIDVFAQNGAIMDQRDIYGFTARDVSTLGDQFPSAASLMKWVHWHRDPNSAKSTQVNSFAIKIPSEKTKYEIFLELILKNFPTLNIVRSSRLLQDLVTEIGQSNDHSVENDIALLCDYAKRCDAATLGEPEKTTAIMLMKMLAAREIYPTAISHLQSLKLSKLAATISQLKTITGENDALDVAGALPSVLSWKPDHKKLDFFEKLVNHPDLQGHEEKQLLRWLLAGHGPAQPLDIVFRSKKDDKPESLHNIEPIDYAAKNHFVALREHLSKIEMVATAISTVTAGGAYQQDGATWMTFHGLNGPNMAPTAEALFSYATTALERAFKADGQSVGAHVVGLMQQLNVACAEAKSWVLERHLGEQVEGVDTFSHVDQLWTNFDQNHGSLGAIVGEHLRSLRARAWRRYAQDHNLPVVLDDELRARFEQDPALDREYLNADKLIAYAKSIDPRLAALKDKSFEAAVDELVTMDVLAYGRST